jgi:hypothetical protein
MPHDDRTNEVRTFRRGFTLRREARRGVATSAKLTVPLAKTITLQGGLIVSGTEETFVNAKDGDTLSPVAEEVPGGYEAKRLTLTLELVGPVAPSRHKLAKVSGRAQHCGPEWHQ